MEISAIQLVIEFQYQHESGCSTVHWEFIFQFESERHQVEVASKDLQGIKGMIYLKFFFYSNNFNRLFIFSLNVCC